MDWKNDSKTWFSYTYLHVWKKTSKLTFLVKIVISEIITQNANFSGDASTVIGLQGALKFNGGGHINHSIFWQNLCPTSDSGEPSPELMAAIERDFGSLDSLKEKLSASTVAVQGSGNICNILQINFLKSHYWLFTSYLESNL